MGDVSLDVAVPGQPRYAVGALRFAEATPPVSVSQLVVTAYQKPVPALAKFERKRCVVAGEQSPGVESFAAYLVARQKAGTVAMPGTREAVLVAQPEGNRLWLCWNPAPAPEEEEARLPKRARREKRDQEGGASSPVVRPPSPVVRPPSPAVRAPSPAVRPPLPVVRPPSPAVRPPSPENRPPSPSNRPPSPSGRPPSPSARPPSPSARPPSPTAAPPLSPGSPYRYPASPPPLTPSPVSEAPAEGDEEPEMMVLPRVPLPERDLAAARFPEAPWQGTACEDCPKGAILHMHFSGYVRYGRLLDHLWSQPHYRSRLRLNAKVPELYFEDRKGEDDVFVGDEVDIAAVRAQVEAAAHDFDVLGKLFYCVVKRFDFLKEYLVLVLQEMLTERVAHVDLRLRLGSAFRVNSRGRREAMSMAQEMTLYLECLEQLFRPHHRSFALIACFSKKARPERIAEYFGKIEALLHGQPLTFGRLVRAYDLVGQEEPFQLRRFASTVEGLSRPFLFHAGEISEGHDNIAFALETGGNRIGHGVHMCGHPELIEKCHERQVALELCPVSNKALGTVADPAIYRKLLDQGLILTISPDDPNKFGDLGMSANLEALLDPTCAFSWSEVHACLSRSFDYALLCDPAFVAQLRRRFDADTCCWLRRHGDVSLAKPLAAIPDVLPSDVVVSFDARSLVGDLKAGGFRPGTWSLMEPRHHNLRRLRQLQSDVFGRSQVDLEAYYRGGLQDVASMVLYAPKGVVAVPAVVAGEDLTIAAVVLEDFTDLVIEPAEALGANYTMETRQLRRATLFYLKQACLEHFRVTISRPCLLFAYVS